MKTKVFLGLGAVVALTGLAACGTDVEMSSQANPDFAGHTYTKVMVEANIADLRWRKKVEYEFCDRITDKTTSDCVQSASVFFPGQGYTDDEMQKRIMDQHIDAILVISATSGVNSTYVPPTIYTNANTNVNGTVTGYGNTAYGNATANTQVTTQAIGGGYINKPWAHYQTSLWQTQDKKMAWYASGDASGNGFSNFDDLIEAAAKETVSHMMDDGVLQEPAKK